MQNVMPSIPNCAWTRPIGLGWDAPYTVRYASNLDDGPWHGMPLGGLGAGCIGRSPRGDFNLWHIDGGEHIFQSLPACQFSVFEQVEGETGQAYALCSEPPADGSLAQWHWYPTQSPHSQLESDSEQAAEPTGTYHALYPRSWFVYENVFQSHLTCEQFSPIWALNYQETSYPAAVFEWTASNPTQKPLTLSIMLSWQNTVGWFTNVNKSPEVRLRDDGSPVYDYVPPWGESTGNFNQWIQSKTGLGLLMDRAGRAEQPLEGEGQWAIAVPRSLGTETFYHTRWNPAGDGADLWQTFAQDGSLPNVHDQTPAMAGEQIGGAIALRITLQPGETSKIPFVLTWDFPVTEFAAGIQYYRRYTDFFGRSGRIAWTIAREGLAAYQDWQTAIATWQQSVLDQDLPDWFKMALFNELYDLTSGGTLWTAADDRDPLGQFAVLECFDYQWYESLDVRLYASFALLMLWPELDKTILKAFARAVPKADKRERVIGYYYTIGEESPVALRKVKNATPHDLGAPNEHPWELTNYTAYQDCNQWKDLGSDFVLQVYRDFVFTGREDWEFLWDCWPAVIAALKYLKTFDLDADGIPENAGAPDQTFDDWKLKGISAYCGGLWIAALEAAIAMGQQLLSYPPTHPIGLIDKTALLGVSIEDSIATYQHWLAQARSRYHDRLWNGEYYRLDTGSSSNVVMADQLCGQFYSRLLALPDVVSEDCTRSALQAIYQACFLNFYGGSYGVANGVLPDGSPEHPDDTHPLEVWTGINFGLAAFMLQMGMTDEAWQIASTVVDQIYTNGLQFRTPEAITPAGTFRACHYLRPLAIWAIYKIVGDATQSEA